MAILGKRLSEAGATRSDRNAARRYYFVHNVGLVDERGAADGAAESIPWDDIWIEICRHIHYEGLPSTVAELTRYVQEWCENQYGKQPGDSTLKPKLGKLYQVLRRDEH